MKCERALKLFLLGWIAGMALYLACMPESNASEFHVLELDHLYAEYKQFLPGGHDTLINQMPGHSEDKELNLHMDTALLKYGYWNNMIHSMTDQSQFRVIGWNFQVGVHLGRALDVQYEHYSQHILDGSIANGFPVQDSIGIVIHLYRKPANGNN